MYTAVVGRTFLKEYNRRHGTEYTAKDFFDEEVFEQIFNHEKYLMWVSNSPFVQGLSKSKPWFDEEERHERLQKFHAKVGQGARDGSIAMGFPASEEKEFATTSGLVSDLYVPCVEEDVYLSWIGGALSLGIAGGYTLLFDNPEITYATFEGWKHYRRFLNNPTFENLLPNKLTSWNGQWLAYRLDAYYSDHFNLETLVRFGAVRSTNDGMVIPPVSWSKLFFSLAQQQESESATASVFSLGSTNKTVGFIPFHFQSGLTLIKLYQKLFGEDEYRLKNTGEFENWFGVDIRRACEMGSIGLQALRPNSLKKYLDPDTNLKFASAAITRKTDEDERAFAERSNHAKQKEKDSIISYQTYKTWLVAMLSKNKTDVSEYSRKIAQALVQYRAGGRKLDRKNLLEKDFFKTNKKGMLEALSKIVSDETVEPEIVEIMNSLRDQVHFLSQEEFGYFVLLLKFDYAFAERNSTTN